MRTRPARLIPGDQSNLFVARSKSQQSSLGRNTHRLVDIMPLLLLLFFDGIYYYCIACVNKLQSWNFNLDIAMRIARHLLVMQQAAMNAERTNTRGSVGQRPLFPCSNQIQSGSAKYLISKITVHVFFLEQSRRNFGKWNSVGRKERKTVTFIE